MAGIGKNVEARDPVNLPIINKKSLYEELKEAGDNVSAVDIESTTVVETEDLAIDVHAAKSSDDGAALITTSGSGRTPGAKHKDITPPERLQKKAKSATELGELASELTFLKQNLPLMIANVVEIAMKPLQNKIDKLTEKTEEYKDALKPLHNEIAKLSADLKSKSDECEDLRQKLDSVNEKLDSQEQYSRRSSLRLHNVDIETYKKNWEAVVKDIASVTDITLHPNDIVKCHPAGKRPNDNQKVQLLVKFTNERIRDQFLRCRKQLSELPQFSGLKISEDLTKTRYFLYKKLMELKRSKKLSSVWTFNGVLHYKVSFEGANQSLTSTQQLQDRFPNL